VDFHYVADHPAPKETGAAVAQALGDGVRVMLSGAGTCSRHQAASFAAQTAGEMISAVRLVVGQFGLQPPILKPVS